MKIITPELKLAADEKRLLLLYRAMERSAAGDFLAIAAEYVRLAPRYRPAFQLIVGGVK